MKNLREIDNVVDALKENEWLLEQALNEYETKHLDERRAERTGKLVHIFRTDKDKIFALRGEGADGFACEGGVDVDQLALLEDGALRKHAAALSHEVDQV